jgi:hypothetical protein
LRASSRKPRLERLGREAVRQDERKELQAAFEKHESETEGHVGRLVRVVAQEVVIIPRILRPGDLHAAGDPPQHVAPPERHLLIDGERMWMGVAPRENRARPAIDPMFRSCAACCRRRGLRRPVILSNVAVLAQPTP